ncbi:glycosyltransferase family 2 protein [Acidihalobacter prosperus]
MKIDIILRTKNRPQFLGRALDSVLAQTNGDWRLFLVNDGGDPLAVDRVVESRLDAFGQRLFRIDNRDSINMAAAFNQALVAGDAPLVACHDDDDTWHPDFLARSLSALESFDHFPVAGCACATMLVEEEIRPDAIVELRRRFFSGRPRGLLSLPEVLLSNDLLTTNSMLLRREILVELGGYDESLPVLQDWELLVRLSRKYDILTIEDELAYYHVRKAPGGNSADNSNAYIGHRAFIEWLYNRWTRQGIAGEDAGFGHLVAVARMLRRIREMSDVELDRQKHAILENSCSIRTWAHRLGGLWKKG